MSAIVDAHLELQLCIGVILFNTLYSAGVWWAGGRRVPQGTKPEVHVMRQ